LGRLRTWFGICAAAMLLVVGVPAAGADDPPPIGYPVQGAMLGALSADALRGTLFTATQTTTIGKVRAFLIGNGSSQSVTATIYVASFSGEPNRLVGRSEPFVVSHSGGTWVELSLSLGAYVEQDREYLLLLHSGATGGAMSIAFDEGGSNRSIFMPIGYGNVPDPLLSSPEYGNASFTFRTYSIYGVEDATLPQSTAAPVLTGPSSAGPGTHQLSVSTGSWSGSPTTFTYQWQSCLPNDVQPDPEDWCEDIPGATSSTLTVTPKPLTTLFRAVVTAGNSRGRVSRSSNVFALSSPTMNLVRPAITGSPRHGSTLTSTFGEWIGLGFQPGGGGPIERLKLRWQR
jgi:hypothetical protein